MKKSFAPFALALLALVCVTPNALAQVVDVNLDAVVAQSDEFALNDAEAGSDEIVTSASAAQTPDDVTTSRAVKPIARQVKNAKKPIARAIHSTAPQAVRVRPTTQTIPSEYIPSYLPLYLTSERSTRDSLVCPWVLPQPEPRFRCLKHKRHGAPYGYGAPCGYPWALRTDAAIPADTRAALHTDAAIPADTPRPRHVVRQRPARRLANPALRPATPAPRPFPARRPANCVNVALSPRGSAPLNTARRSRPSPRPATAKANDDRSL